MSNQEEHNFNFCSLLRKAELQLLTMIPQVKLFLFIFWKNSKHQKDIYKSTDLYCDFEWRKFRSRSYSSLWLRHELTKTQNCHLKFNSTCSAQGGMEGGGGISKCLRFVMRGFSRTFLWAVCHSWEIIVQFKL